MLNSIRGWARDKRDHVLKMLNRRWAPATDEAHYGDEVLGHLWKGVALSLKENSHLQKLHQLGVSFGRLGNHAGQLGLRQENINSIGEMQTHLIRSEIEEKCASIQRTLESEVEMRKSIKINAEKDYRSQNDYHRKLNRAYQYHPRAFSPLLGLIYAFFGTALLAADIPLALELIKQGFNLHSDADNPISDLFRYESGAWEFLLHFLQVLTTNWEVVLYAAGVAFCTIYVKIYYDDYVAVPLENLIKKSGESPREGYEDLQENDQRAEREEESAVRAQFDRLWRIRFIIKTAVLALLIFAILILGVFRCLVVANGGTSDGIRRVSQSVPAFLTYFVLTLLFPIISGICASLSLNCFQNWIEKGRAERKNAAAQKRLQKATKAFQEQEAERERNKGFIGWLNEPATIRRLNEYMLACYELGFKFGYLHPKWDFEGDLFTRAEALRQRNLVNSRQPSIGQLPGNNGAAGYRGAK